MSFLGENPDIAYPLTAAFGLVMGSFLSTVVTRLPARIDWRNRRKAYGFLNKSDVYDPPPPDVLTGRAHCPQCKATLSWHERIPLVSYALSGGKCRHCGQPIGAMYPLLELLTMALTLFSVWRFGFGWQGFGAMLLGWYLIAASFIDIRHGLLPDKLTLPLMWLGLVASTDALFLPAKPALLGAVGGYVIFWFVGGLFKQLRGKSGLGRGDYKLLAAIGAWVGVGMLLPTIFLSSVLGLLIGGAVWALKGRSAADPLPFGPFLALAGLLIFMIGPEQVQIWLWNLRAGLGG